MNRLNLNFKLVTNEERSEFVNQYLERDEFKRRPPSESELETIANYILYGRDSDGKNAVQKKEVQIATKNGTWDRAEEKSLNEMIESPTFNESELHPLYSENAPTKLRRENFSRTEARKIPELAKILEPIWKQIDLLDLTLNFYDLKTGKRKSEPREELLRRLTSEEINACREKSTHLNPFTYLKKRHLLVELRREQYTYRDSFVQSVQRLTPQTIPYQIDPIELDYEIPVFPLGLKDSNRITKLIFRPYSELNPKNFSEKELREILVYLWDKRAQEETFTSTLNKNDLYFNFKELEHIYQLFLSFFEVQESFAGEQNFLLETLLYYTDQTDLDEVQREILNLKIKKGRNSDIAAHINQKYGKSYTANYISTIFRQKILTRIIKTAAFHEKILENLCYEENFKKCNTCGRVFLVDPENFVRKARASDGFSNRCKFCDKRERRRVSRLASTPTSTPTSTPIP